MKNEDIDQMLAAAAARGRVLRRARRDNDALPALMRRRANATSALFILAAALAAVVWMPAKPYGSIYTSDGYSRATAYHTALQIVNIA